MRRGDPGNVLRWGVRRLPGGPSLRQDLDSVHRRTRLQSSSPEFDTAHSTDLQTLRSDLLPKCEPRPTWRLPLIRASPAAPASLLRLPAGLGHTKPESYSIRAITIRNEPVVTKLRPALSPLSALKTRAVCPPRQIATSARTKHGRAHYPWAASCVVRTVAACSLRANSDRGIPRRALQPMRL
jgi:hypothetical protein